MFVVRSLILIFVFLTSIHNAWSTTISYERIIPFGFAPLFDPTIGTLDSVFVSVDLSEDVYAAVSNSGAETRVFTVSDSAYAQLELPGLIWGVAGSYSIDFVAPPNTATPAYGKATLIDSFLFEGPDISGFIGVGDFDFHTNGVVYGTGISEGMIPDITPLAWPDSFNGTEGTVSFTYNYTPAPVPAPAPAAIWLFALGLIELTLFARRDKGRLFKFTTK